MTILALVFFTLLSVNNTHIDTVVNNTDLSISVACEFNQCHDARSQDGLDDVTDALDKIKNELGNTNDKNLILTGISIIIATLAAISAFLTAYYANKQVEQSKKETQQKETEMRLRFRARLIIDGPIPKQVILNDGHTISYENYVNTSINERTPAETVVMAIPYRNDGQYVANNAKLVFILNEIPFTRKIFEKESLEKNQIEEKDILPVAPNQEQFRSFIIPFERFIQLKEKPLYVGVSISYDSYGDRAYSGVIYKIKSGQNEGIDAWFP